MACVLATALLTCASSAYAQVIEEGEFPIKGGGIPGESFSLSCPPRLVAQAGESILLSCAATDVSEEAIHDRWESPSGNNLRLLSYAHSHSFTVPVSGAGEEYHYIASMTTSASGVPRTARRRVTVRVVEGEEDASALANKGRVPSITCNDAEVYESTADFTLDCSVTDEPSDATYAWTARGSTSDTNDLSSTTVLKPTFSVPGDIDERNGADKDYEYTVTLSASGINDITEDVTVTVLEKYDISPARGCSINWFYDSYTSTISFSYTNQVYEAESDFQFPRCGYRGAPAPAVYRFSWTTSGSTPSSAISLLSATDIGAPFFRVPDEVSEDKTYEYTMTVSADNADPALISYTVDVKNRGTIVVACGDATFTTTFGTPPIRAFQILEEDSDYVLWCSAAGAPVGSDYTYAWTARGSTANTDLLSATNIASPTFDVPDTVESTETYEYKLTVSADNAVEGSREVLVIVYDMDIMVTCEDSPYDVDESDADIELECDASGGPVFPTDEHKYSWDWSPTTNLTDHYTATPTFSVPEDVDRDTTWTYTVTALTSVPGFLDWFPEESTNVTVTVRNRSTGTGTLSIVCTDPGSVYEGSEDITLDCSASGAPPGSSYAYAWTARGTTSNTDRLSSTTIAKPTFDVPEEVAADETYEYTLTVSADNVDDATADVTVTVRNRSTGTGTLSIVCTDPGSVYEGSEDITLDCSASGAPPGSSYAYAWTARGTTSNTDRLSSTTIAKPTFDVPEEVAADETYEYTLTVSAENANDGTANVTVTVLDLHKPGSIEEDRLALEALYDSTNGNNWIDNTDWKSDKPVQEWYGVSVDLDDGRIRALNLDGNGLSGNIPSGMSNLKNLDSLDLADNYLTGTIPESFIDLSLTLFHIGGTNTVTIPSSLIPWYNSISNTDIAAPTASESTELPEILMLGGNYPNPFNPVTTIEYALPATDHVRLVVYDLAGHEVAVLVDEVKPAGNHTVRFDAVDMPSGLYVCRLQAAGKIDMHAMILVK